MRDFRPSRSPYPCSRATCTQDLSLSGERSHRNGSFASTLLFPFPRRVQLFFFFGDIWTSFQETNRKPHSPFPRLPQKRKIWKAISYDFSWASVKPRVSQTTGYYLFCPWFRIFSFDSVSLHYVLHWIKLHNYLTLTLGATQQETGQNNAPVVTLVRTTKDGSYVM